MVRVARIVLLLPIELVASGGNNIAAPAAGTYVVKFYANRTPCVVKMVKQ